MRPGLSEKDELIAALRPHCDSAIRDSPCTCVGLRAGHILDLAMAHGLDARTRIGRFLGLSRAAQHKFRVAMSRRRRNPRLDRLIKKAYATEAPASDTPTRNKDLNSLYLECGLGRIVQECEEVAVSYNAALRYAWALATCLTRFTWGEGELEIMLGSFLFMSTVRPFVSTPVTRSPWFAHYDISYTIGVTPEYRKRAIPLTYTSVFATTSPETMRGFKSYRFFEDEIRIPNGTPIERGTIGITFRSRILPQQSRIDGLVAKYAPLGTVRVLLRS